MATLALEHNLDRIRRRMRLLLALRWGVRFALAATLAALLWLVGAKLTDIPFSGAGVALFLILALLAGAAFGALRRLSRFQAALITDARLGLQERLSSALDLLHQPEPDPLVAALVADATRCAATIDARAVFPVKAPRETCPLAAALAILAAALFVPNLSPFQSEQRRAEREAMRAEGERITRVAKEMRRAAAVSETELQRRIARNLEQLGKEMQAAHLSKKQALVMLNQLADEVAAAQRQLAPEAAGKSLAQAGEELAKAAANTARADAGKRLSEMAQALKTNDLQRAAQLLEQMAEQAAADQTSAEEAKALADQAREIAQALNDTSLQEAASSLQKAAQQLDQQQLAAAADQFRQAGGT